MSETTTERAVRGSEATSPLARLSASDRKAEEVQHSNRVNRAEERRRLARWAVDDLRAAVGSAEKLAKDGQKFATADTRGGLPMADGLACGEYHKAIDTALAGLVSALGAAQFILAMREAEFARVVGMTDEERYEAAFG